MTPLVSIIIPVYKAEQTLPACLAQLKAQTYRHLQIIFVDDCSPDGGLVYLKGQKPQLEELGMEVDILHHEVNQGVASARNTGLSAVRGEYIYSVDADDELNPRAIQLFVERAQQTGADIIGCEYHLSQGSSLRHIRQDEVEPLALHDSPIADGCTWCFTFLAWGEYGRRSHGHGKAPLSSIFGLDYP